ncbi:histidine kinase [Microbacterium sp.]|uniref:histidine kinase n=1 Tax=Microbacterium sp. TaxID=51671 RepID=UPI003A8FA9AB
MVLAVDAIGVLVLAIWQVLALLAGDVESAASAIALIVLTVVGAAAIGAFCVGVLRDSSWGRSGGIVTQLLVLAVALGAVTGAYAHPLIGLALAAAGLVGLVPLVLEVRRSGRDRRDAEDDDDR